MTDKIEETHAQGAADWYLDMETLVDSILKVGSRNQELQYMAFNVKTIFTIISKLPYNLLSRTYELDTQGEEKMKQVLQLIKKARVVAHARATDMAIDMTLSSTAMGLAACSRPPETGHMMVNPTPPPSPSSQFTSWAEIVTAQLNLNLSWSLT